MGTAQGTEWMDKPEENLMFYGGSYHVSFCNTVSPSWKHGLFDAVSTSQKITASRGRTIARGTLPTEHGCFITQAIARTVFHWQNSVAPYVFTTAVWRTDVNLQTCSVTWGPAAVQQVNSFVCILGDWLNIILFQPDLSKLHLLYQWTLFHFKSMTLLFVLLPHS